MRRKWMTYGAAVLLLLAGCGKSGDKANQAASGTPDASTATPGQTQEPGRGTNGRSAGEMARKPEAPRPFEVAAGTPVPVILSSALSSKVNQPGQEFEASLAAPILVGGEVAVPKDALVRGVVVDAKKQGMFKGEADLAVKLTNITVRGKDYPISTDVYGATQKGKGKRTAVVTGGGAALGALIGGLAGGGKGAAIGAGVGAGGGLAASGTTGGKNVELPAESKLTFRLSQPVTIDR